MTTSVVATTQDGSRARAQLRAGEPERRRSEREAAPEVLPQRVPLLANLYRRLVRVAVALGDLLRSELTRFLVAPGHFRGLAPADALGLVCQISHRKSPPRRPFARWASAEGRREDQKRPRRRRGQNQTTPMGSDTLTQPCGACFLAAGGGRRGTLELQAELRSAPP